MADILLKNQGFINSEFDEQPLNFETNIAETTLIDGIEAEKTADRVLWLNGELEYTVVITNTSGVTIENAKFSDTLDAALIVLVDDSVTIDGTAATYTYVGDLLSVDLPDILTGESVTIKFRVVKV